VRDWSAPETSDSSSDPEAPLRPGCTPAIDYRRRFGRDVVGVRAYEGHLVAVIAVDGPADAPPGRHQSQTISSDTLPVAAVAAGLHQFDVHRDAQQHGPVLLRRHERLRQHHR
jgi:type VII secretion protein EccE